MTPVSSPEAGHRVLRLNKKVIDCVRHFAQANQAAGCESVTGPILSAADVVRGPLCSS